MLTTQFPFKTIADILKGEFAAPDAISDDCFDLLKRMLVVKKEHRETLEGVLNHQWIKRSPEEIYQQISTPIIEPVLKRRKSSTGESLQTLLNNSNYL